MSTTMTVVWSADQERALEKVTDWATSGRQREFRLGGLAGSGKTHLSGHMARLLVDEGVPVTFAAPTGRATSVLASKFPDANALTVHSLLRHGPNGVSHEEDCDKGPSCECTSSMTFSERAPTFGTMSEEAVVFVDEASMINSWMFDKLVDLGAKILFVGDFGQLPPVGDGGFSVVDEHLLDAKLTTIHRQAAGDPILDNALSVRRGGGFVAGGSVRVVPVAGPRSAPIGYVEGRLVLTTTNSTRVYYNTEIRAKRWGRDLDPSKPMVGDALVCMTTDHPRGVFNGERGVVTRVSETRDRNILSMDLRLDDGRHYNAPVLRHGFNHRKKESPSNSHGAWWDYGYAMTVWKAQGSEADEVLFIDEHNPYVTASDRPRLLYTAVTRARKSLTVVTPR